MTAIERLNTALAGRYRIERELDGPRFVAVPATESAATAGATQPSRCLILRSWFGELRRLTGTKPR